MILDVYRRTFLSRKLKAGIFLLTYEIYTNPLKLKKERTKTNEPQTNERMAE